MRRAGFIAALIAGGAVAAPGMVVSASGDCRDAEVLGDARLLTESLKARVGAALVTEEQLAQKLGAEPTRSLEELDRQLESAKTDFYRGDMARAEASVAKVLDEIPLLPPGAPRWALEQRALLQQSAIAWAKGRVELVDEDFRRLLRLEPELKLDPDYFSPALQKRFEKLRAELKAARKATLSIRSTPAGADVFLDGKPMGATPYNAPAAAGTYQLVVGKEGALSLAHAVQAKGETVVHVDLAFEGAVRGHRLPCVADDGAEASRLANAVKLAKLMEADQAVVVHLERAAGQGWFAAAMVQVQTAQKIREGGLKVETPGKAPDGLDELADFIVTGQPSHKILTEAPKPVDEVVAPAPAVPVASPPPTLVQQETPPEKTWRTKAGFGLVGAGLLVGIGGAYFGTQAGKEWTAFNGYYTGGAQGPGPGDLPVAQGARNRGQIDAGLAWTGAGLAAVALGAGAFLIFTDGPGKASVSVIPGPANLSIAGRLP